MKISNGTGRMESSMVPGPEIRRILGGAAAPEKGDAPSNGRIIPLHVRETEGYFLIEVEVPGFKSEEISLSANARIVTISFCANGRPSPGRKARRSSVSVYLDSPVDPAYTLSHFARGRLYLKMLKDPMASARVSVHQIISG